MWRARCAMRGIACSCSTATRAQVTEASSVWNTHLLDPERLSASHGVVDELLAAAVAELDSGPVLIYSTAEPARVRELQETLGREAVAELVETAMGRLARGLVAAGVDQLVVAGGETSGAVVQALDIAALNIGPEICPGVPWCESLDEPGLAIALKSGNFGDRGFFMQAFEQLDD